MNDHRHVPNLDRLSVILAIILIAYAIASFISFPTQTLNIQLPGFLLTLNLNIYTLIVIIVAVLAAAGTEWLISVHPHLPAEGRWQHWLIPAFTAAALGVPLDTLRVSSAWWVVFAFGGVLLAAVFIAEYISVDRQDMRFSFAALGLIDVSFALFLVLVTASKGAGLRLYVLLATLIPTVFLITARSMYLRLGGKWKLAWAGGITLILAQLTASLFYLPLRPLTNGLILLGAFYGLVTVATNLEEKQPAPAVWLEPVLMGAVFLGLSLLIK